MGKGGKGGKGKGGAGKGALGQSPKKVGVSPGTSPSKCGHTHSPGGGCKHVSKFAPKADFDFDDEEDMGNFDMATLMKALDPANFLNNLAPEIQTRVRGLKYLQKQHDELYSKMVEEINEIRQKYNAKFAPLHEKRFKIVNGDEEPKEDELADLVDPKPEPEDKDKEEKKEEEKPAEKEKTEDAGPVKGVPSFWLKALLNNQALSESITEKDEEALEYLTNISCEDTDPKTGSFTLKFQFKENPFFDNTVLTKSFVSSVSEDPYDEGDIDKLIGTEINWKAGKNLTFEERKKKQKKKGARGAVKTITQKVPVESFFHFFKTLDIPDTPDGDEDEMDQMDEEIQMHMDQGLTIKERIIPCAVRWYSGEATRLEDQMFFGGEGDEEDEEDEDEEDEEDEAPQKKAAPRKGAGKGKQGSPAPAGKPAENPPECKQQ